MYFKPGEIWPDSLPICGGRGRGGGAAGRVSEYDHPPEGNWLTLSPHTFVWVAAGLAEASALIATSAEAPPQQGGWEAAGICHF